MNPSKKSSWRNPQLADVVLISGPENYSVGEAIRGIKKKIRDKHSHFEIAEIDASEYVSGHLINLASPSLFAEPRLIIITNCDHCTDAFIEDGKTYLADPAADTTVVIHHSGSSVRGKALIEAIKASEMASEILCPKITKDSERVAFVKQFFSDSGRAISDGAVRALTQAFSQDIPELAAAANQLLADSSETITEEIVDRYYGGRVEVDAFKIIDAALNGRAGDALFMLRHAFASGLDLVLMVAGFNSRIRSMAKVYANPRANAASLGLSDWVASQARGSLAGWDDDGLGRVIQALADSDAAAKGAERDPQYRLEQLIALIARKGQAL